MRQELHDERRASILTAARAVFFAKGFARTRIVEVSRSARVANSTLYSYFETKLELFEAVVAGALAPYRGLFDEIAHLRADPTEALGAWTRAYFRFQSDPQVRGLYRLITAEQQANPELGEHIYTQCRDLIGAVLRGLLQNYTDEGRLRIPSPAMASRLLEGMVEHAALTIAMFQGDDAPPMHPAEEYCAEVVRVFLAGYSATPDISASSG